MSKKGKKSWLTVVAAVLVAVPTLGALGVLPPVAVAVLTAAAQAVLGGPAPVAAP